MGIDNNSLKALYEWKDGVKTTESMLLSEYKLFESGTLLPLEDITYWTEVNREEKMWEERYYPIIADFQGDYLLFCNKIGEYYGSLFLYSVAYLTLEEPELCYKSIEALIETTTDAYEQNILSYDIESHILNCDYDSYFHLAKRKNPNCNFWQSAE